MDQDDFYAIFCFWGFIFIIIGVLIIIACPDHSRYYDNLSCVNQEGVENFTASSDVIFFNGQVYLYDKKSYTPYQGDVCEINKIKKTKD